MRLLCLQRICLILFAICACLGCGADAQEKFEKIPLDRVFSTNRQEGVKEPPERKLIEDLSKLRNGASNIFLVTGKDINEAILATRKVVSGGVPGGRMNLARPEDEHSWLVVYFGLGASGPEWTIEGVERSGKTVRVRYRTHPVTLADSRVYYAWIPLGVPQFGKYQLEMWDDDAGEKTLSRTYVVLPRN
jgi:hypothetical protein